MSENLKENLRTYLVTYRADCGHGEETFAEMANVYGIAELYGFSDQTGVHNIRAFRITDDGSPVEVGLDPVIGKNIIRIIDRETGEVFTAWNWPEH